MGCVSVIDTLPEALEICKTPSEEVASVVSGLPVASCKPPAKPSSDTLTVTELTSMFNGGGGGGAATMSKLTVAVLIPPLPSEIVYVNEAKPL